MNQIIRELKWLVAGEQLEPEQLWGLIRAGSVAPREYEYPQVLVIGAGMVGPANARAAALAGHEVVVVEAQDEADFPLRSGSRAARIASQRRVAISKRLPPSRVAPWFG